MQKTYLMVNKDELFAVLVCNKKTGTFVYKNIGNKDSLIAFIAQHLNGFNSFDNFLLKRDYQIAKTQGEDLGKKFDRWLRAEKFDLYYLHDAFLYGTKNIFFSQAYFVPRTNNLEYSITFYTLAGRTIDIRNYIDDVRAFIVAGKLFDEPTQTMQKKNATKSDVRTQLILVQEGTLRTFLYKKKFVKRKAYIFEIKLLIRKHDQERVIIVQDGKIINMLSNGSIIHKIEKLKFAHRECIGKKFLCKEKMRLTS